MLKLRAFFYVFICGMCLAAPSAEAKTLQPFTLDNGFGGSRSVDFSQHRVTVLHFWATWCRPCVKELPGLNAAQQAFESRGLHVLAISLDDDTLAAQSFLGERQISLPLVFDPSGQLFRQFGSQGVPTSVFVNAKGEVLEVAVGVVEWESPRTQHQLNAWLR